MARDYLQVYSVQINGKCICATFPPPLHDLIISLDVKHPSKNMPKNVCSPMQSFFKKKVPPYFGGEGGVDTMLYLNIFSHF